MSITNFDPVISAAMQQGLLVPGFKAHLEGRRAFSNFTFKHRMPGRIGVLQRFTQNTGLAVADLNPRNPADISSNLDNGMTYRKSGLEQYEITLNEWDDASQVDLMQDEALIASDFVRSLGNLGQSAYEKKEFLIRKAYLDAYVGGCTPVVAGGTLSTTQAHVDDIRGFQKTLDNTGAYVDVSGTNTILVDEIDPSTGGTVQTLTVTGATADGSNSSNLAANFVGGISGQISFLAATQPVVGHLLRAQNAPKVFRAGGKLHSSLLSKGDIATFDGPSAISTYLRNQGLLGVKGKPVICVTGFSMLEQLKKDPLFLSAYNGRGRDPDIADGLITEFDGVLYIPSNFVPMSTNADGTTVARALFIGSDEACMEADWEGFDNFIAGKGKGVDAIHHYEKMDNNMALTLRAPLDVKGRIQPMAYSLVTGFCCGSDLKANQNVPTASAAFYKKAAWYEHAISV